MHQHYSTVQVHSEHQPAWDFYCCEVDEKPAIISLDLNLADGTKHSHTPYLVYLSIKLDKVSPEGFPLPSDLGNLCKIEDHILSFLLERTTTVFCGRVTTNGCRDLIFYTKNPTAALVVLKTAMQDFAAYKFETGWREDEEWDTYFSFLFPNERELNNIFNQRAIKRMNKNGQQLQPDSIVLHRILLPSETERDLFILGAIDDFFRVKNVQPKPHGKKTYWEVLLFKVENINIAMLNAATSQLLELARHTNGVYEGWEVAD